MRLTIMLLLVVGWTNITNPVFAQEPVSIDQRNLVFIGIVKNNSFISSEPKGNYRLFVNSIVDGTKPKQLDLSKYEGKVIMVKGFESTQDIYDAKVIIVFDSFEDYENHNSKRSKFIELMNKIFSEAKD